MRLGKAYKMIYSIHRTTTPPALTGGWDDAVWGAVPALVVDRFHAKSGDHHPTTRAKLLYDSNGLYVIFDVQDRYVECVCTQPQGPVCRDSCVEFFVQPSPPGPYFNFEINCGGTPLVHFMEDWRIIPGQGFKKNTPVSAALLQQLHIYHSLPRMVHPPRSNPTRWCVEYFIPFGLFEHYLGPLGEPSQRIWRGNFYKCGSSHAHWASWAPLGEELNFHQPRYFGTLQFAV